MTDFCVCYNEEDRFCPVCEAEFTRTRAESDATDFLYAAYAEDYDRDWTRALFDHDWFCNRCTGRDHFGERCKKRQGHTHRHDATFNGYMQFIYDERKIQNLVYTDSPLLRMVPR